MTKGLTTFCLLAALVAVARFARISELLTQGGVQDKTAAAVALAAPIAGWLLLRRHRTGKATAGRGARGLVRNGKMEMGMTIIGCLTLMAVIAPVLSPYAPSDQLSLATLRLQPPSWHHPLGTDDFSRDILARAVYGARLSLGIAFISVTVLITVGATVGMISGLSGGAIDNILMRCVDAGRAIPRIFFMIVILALWTDIGAVGFALALGLTGWFGTSRLVRAEILTLREREFVSAARAAGVGSWRLAIRHLLPNAVSPIIVTAALSVGGVILIEAGLSYLGIGVRPPTPTWGNMIREGQEVLIVAPWFPVIPGFAIVLTVLGFSLLGDGLRDALDPRSRSS